MCSNSDRGHRAMRSRGAAARHTQDHGGTFEMCFIMSLKWESRILGKYCSLISELNLPIIYNSLVLLSTSSWSMVPPPVGRCKQPPNFGAFSAALIPTVYYVI